MLLSKTLDVYGLSSLAQTMGDALFIVCNMCLEGHLGLNNS
uniref:Uncharacterized protein n=1 Tax=Rhizophora mucronata TaxID=61149 RepID=A0A2P2NGU3_RHIMU